MVDILAIGAHPDDVELAYAGTLLAHQALGHSIAIADLTRGELGTRGSAEQRDKEAEESAKILGVSERINLSLKDGFLNQDEQSLLRVVEAIRYFKPKIVLANATEDRHPDHGISASLVSRACFLSGLPKIKTSYKNQEQAAHRPNAIYHSIQDRYIKPDLVIDITPFFDKKRNLFLRLAPNSIIRKARNQAHQYHQKNFSTF